ncbi:MAG: thioredoxin family protein [Euryarchaeota archaeon]|nr:thioredoxin family protein [Euryarchaeota archaeon]
MKLKPSMRYVAILAVLCLLSVGMSGCISQSGYEFKSGITPPKAVSDLMKNGSVILFITQNNCPACEQTRPMITDLQKQYNGTNVTFVNFNIDNNTTSRNVGQVYGVSATPTTVVLRKDGAAAIFVGVFDENIVKSAIEDARK